MTAELRDLIAQLTDELEQLSDLVCSYGQFATCQRSPDCVRRRGLIAAARNDASAWLDDVDQLRTDHAQLTSVPELRRRAQ